MIPAIRHNLGLTLVEMIAALIILSAATTAGIGILQNASSSAQDATRRMNAVDAYEQWRQHELLNPTATLPWSWVDGNGNVWMIADAGSRSAGALRAAVSAPTSTQAQPAPQAPLQWRTITVTLEQGANLQPAITIERLELAPAPLPTAPSGRVAP